MKKFIYLIILISITFCFQLYNTDKPSGAPSFDEALPDNTAILPSNSILKAQSHFPKENPADCAPLLEWTKDLNAVYYEFELFGAVPVSFCSGED